VRTTTEPEQQQYHNCREPTSAATMSLLHDFAMLRIMSKFSFRAISTWERITHPQTPACQEMSRGYVRGGKIVALHITMLISGENSMLCMSDRTYRKHFALKYTFLPCLCV
jgi:hypothetical protein